MKHLNIEQAKGAFNKIFFVEQLNTGLVVVFVSMMGLGRTFVSYEDY
jgi:hypothetical protein